ncbi:prolyl oligopeptidase family protein [Actinomyces sp.]|uniref:prolyl oligopeptidase family serine peptidase n=1 Tax=Actinomyces sp. TaxID=29317 RepID=UPI0026DCBC76|nr:prolyl oligopeptidase family serine peptidase [Actinomyces sp.]MDO4901776.1 prolyl oligopeptidase family serine peptidase [Actinomyces sp.]
MNTTPAASSSSLQPVPDWLDEIEGVRALSWVARRNAATRAAYDDSPEFTQLRTTIEAILDSPDRIPEVSEAAGALYNFWTDAAHPRGLWRRTTWEAYRAGSSTSQARTAAPSRAAPAADSMVTDPTDWEVLLDLDALCEEEGVNWVWSDASMPLRGPLTGRRALINLSDGGSDTDITREFDLDERRFLPGPDQGGTGFVREPSKGFLDWGDDEGNTVLLATDFGEGSLTPSGYPRQVRRLRRGQSPQAGEVLLTAPADAEGAWGFHDPKNRVWLLIHPDFYSSELWLLPEGAEVFTAASGADHLTQTQATIAPGALRVDVPASATVTPVWDLLLIELREDWQTDAHTTYPAGSLLAAPIEAFLGGSRDLTVLFTPTPTTSLSGFTMTAHHLLLSILDDCVTSVEVLTPTATDGSGPWSRRPLRLPGTDDGAACTGSDSPQTQATQDQTLLRPGRPLIEFAADGIDPLHDDRVWLTRTSFTSPSALMLGELNADGRLADIEVLREAPWRFDASGVAVTQHVAVSDDGTRVPYFQIGRPRLDNAGNPIPSPTLLYGYGGFEIPLGIGYLSVIGKAWLERGGTYVVANIRGGGEYGPAWHQAAAKEHRHRTYEDFASVARALAERGVTSPERLAVHGGSNGGLLAGVMLTRYPDLVGAVVCEVPLLDMRRYIHLLAGPSWEPEYGDPDDPAQWEFIRGFSPFHLLEPGRTYPPVLLLTSTRDDRVHPAHARTMAYRMLELGQDVTYFENNEGGHGGAATNKQQAYMNALTYEFAWRTLTRE